MTLPKAGPCPKCGNIYTELYGYGDGHFLNWHVECDECHYMGPCGNKLQAIRQHNAAVNDAPERTHTDILEAIDRAIEMAGGEA